MEKPETGFKMTCFTLKWRGHVYILPEQEILELSELDVRLCPVHT